MTQALPAADTAIFVPEPVCSDHADPLNDQIVSDVPLAIAHALLFGPAPSEEADPGFRAHPLPFRSVDAARRVDDPRGPRRRDGDLFALPGSCTQPAPLNS